MAMFKIEDHYFKKLPNKDSIVVDIGANIGLFSRKILSDFHSRVIAYEPMRHLCVQYLKPIKEQYGNFEYYNKAVWINDGKMNFMNFGKEWLNKSMPNPWGAGTLLGFSGKTQKKDCFGNSLTQEEIIVDVISIDNVLKEFEAVNLLKMDCEGAEIRLLNEVDEKQLLKCEQISVEFHVWIGDKYIPPITMQQVNKIVERMSALGFKNNIQGGHPDILFYKE
jgi:FkbM family methyltransferase